MPTYVLLSERRWWPLVLGVPGMFALWIVPDWLGSGDLLHTFHLARISAEPRTLQGTGDPALELLRGAAGIQAAPVWIGALCGLAWGWRARDRTVAALALVAAAWVLPTVAGTAMGYPAVPRYLVVPAAIACVLAGIGLVAVTRLAPGPRGRAALAAALVAVCAPFAVSRAIGLGAPGRRVEGPGRRGLRAVARCRSGPARGSRRAAAPGHPAEWHGQRPGLEARAPLDHVAAWFSPTARVAFIAGDDRPVIARLRRRNATAVRIAAAPPWHVLLVRWSSRSTRELRARRRRAWPRRATPR